MGNSLLDVIVFGRDAGKNAAEKAKETVTGALSLSHVSAFEQERERAGITGDAVSPRLLPSYTHRK